MRCTRKDAIRGSAEEDTTLQVHSSLDSGIGGLSRRCRASCKAFTGRALVSIHPPVLYHRAGAVFVSIPHTHRTATLFFVR